MSSRRRSARIPSLSATGRDIPRLQGSLQQFFWRWERFEKAIEDEQNEVFKAVLLQIRPIVKADLAEAFAVSKELVPHVITFKHF